MGEIADMMLEGDLCAGCGVYMHGDALGAPRYCSDCKRAAARPHPSARIECPTCKRRVKACGLADHQRVVHGSQGGAA